MTGSPFPANNPQQVLFHPSGHLMYYINSSSRIITNFVDPSSTTGSFIDAQRTTTWQAPARTTSV